MTQSQIQYEFSVLFSSFFLYTSSASSSSLDSTRQPTAGGSGLQINPQGLAGLAVLPSGLDMLGTLQKERNPFAFPPRPGSEASLG